MDPRNETNTPETQDIQTAETQILPKPKSEKPKAKAKSSRMTEEEILQDYPHVIPGTLTFLDVENKQAVKIKCKTEGCEHTRTVRTSDLWQVECCESCTRKARRERTRERRKAKKDADKADAS